MNVQIVIATLQKKISDLTLTNVMLEAQISDLQSQLKYDDEETFTYAAWSKERGGDAYNDIKSLEDSFKLFDLKNVRFDPTLIRGL